MKSNAAKGLVAIAVVVFAWPAFRVQQLLRLEGKEATRRQTIVAARFIGNVWANQTNGRILEA